MNKDALAELMKQMGKFEKTCPAIEEHLALWVPRYENGAVGEVVRHMCLTGGTIDCGYCIKKELYRSVEKKLAERKK
ncbi:hypothetical protein HOK51_09175 [Candidatus Woesearchaeota archaeon]|jgi:hypothetical protein|nr:hypothetical protein [Candidatus Woesearchaeota archaeon]MBT6520001.1 hypothetical protein [Candidatus Woesearchaeota archaeon]MBT7367752.1 hypothetical protein [Candidatus Woesearchaeota archaeon]